MPVNRQKPTSGITKRTRYPLVSSDTRKVLRASVGSKIESWSFETANLLGVYVFPGENFYLARDLLVYPKTSFLACGMLGLCGVALYPRKKLPFLDFTITPDGHLDSLTDDCLFEYGGWDPQKERVRDRIARMRDFLVWNFRRGDGKYSIAGEKDALVCLEKGRLADWEKYSK
jgi:hypothetical protein